MPRLGLAVPYFELFMTGWEELQDNEPRLRPWLDVGLRWATKYYNRMDDTIAYVVAMRTCLLAVIIPGLKSSFSVVEPSIRMSWIEDHWDEAYIKRSKKVVLDLVRPNIPASTCVLDHPNQMHSYHKDLPKQRSTENQPHLGDLDAIAARLRIKDMGGRRNTRDVVNTVEDEYRSYTKGALTKQGDDPLKFWDVRTFLVCHCADQLILMNTYRQIAKRIRSSSQLRWTTFPSKHPPSPASESFRPVRKRTRRNGTSSVPSLWRPFKCLNSTTSTNVSISLRALH